MSKQIGQKAVELLEELVAIPSVNPSFHTPNEDDKIFGEYQYAKRLREILSDAGCEVWLEEVLPGRPNIMARLSNGEKRPSIALQSHMDTVQISGMTVPPWGRREGDRFYGRGSCDTKATAAVFIQIIRHLAEYGDLDVDLYFIGTIDEEQSFAGSRYVGQHYRFDACIIGEPSALQPVTANKGSFRFEIMANGVAAHSSTPEHGHNAIFEMLDLLGEFGTSFDQYTGNRSHHLTGRATWTPTMIQGGTGLNTVPEFCRVSIDRRVVPGEDLDEILSFIDGWFENQVRADSFWRRGEILLKDPPFEIDPDAPPVKALRHVLEERKLNSHVMGAPYGTDAGKIAMSGTPCVIFGPGDIKQAHKKDEWIFLPEVELATEIALEAVKYLGKMLREGS